MRKALVLSMGVILIATTGGCGPNQEEVRTEAEREQALRESAFGSMAESIDRAAEVEQLQQDRKNRIDAALE